MLRNRPPAGSNSPRPHSGQPALLNLRQKPGTQTGWRSHTQTSPCRAAFATAASGPPTKSGCSDRWLWNRRIAATAGDYATSSTKCIDLGEEQPGPLSPCLPDEWSEPKTPSRNRNLRFVVVSSPEHRRAPRCLLGLCTAANQLDSTISKQHRRPRCRDLLTSTHDTAPPSGSERSAEAPVETASPLPFAEDAHSDNRAEPKLLAPPSQIDPCHRLPSALGPAAGSRPKRFEHPPKQDRSIVDRAG